MQVTEVVMKVSVYEFCELHWDFYEKSFYDYNTSRRDYVKKKGQIYMKSFSNYDASSRSYYGLMQIVIRSLLRLIPPILILLKGKMEIQLKAGELYTKMHILHCYYI